MTDDRIVAGDGRTRTGEEIPVEHIEVRGDHRHDGTVVEQVPDYIGDTYRSRVSWGAIFAGTVVGIGVLLMLSLAGMAIGLSAADFGPGQDGFEGFTTGAGIWLVISQLIALAVGGFVAGRLAAVPKTTSTAFHGAAVWGLATLLMAYMATSAIGSAVNTATSAISSVASGVASVAPAAVPSQGTQNDIAAQTDQIVSSVLSDREKNRATDAVQNSAQNVASGDATVGEAVRNVTNTLFGRGGVIGDDDRQQAINEYARRTGVSQAEAAETVGNIQTQVESFANNAPATINNVATEATDALATAAFWGFVASLLGLVAAIVAATMGRPGKHTEYVRS